LVAKKEKILKFNLRDVGDKKAFPSDRTGRLGYVARDNIPRT
jgi:hypothetical protein